MIVTASDPVLTIANDAGNVIEGEAKEGPMDVLDVADANWISPGPEPDGLFHGAHVGKDLSGTAVATAPTIAGIRCTRETPVR